MKKTRLLVTGSMLGLAMFATLPAFAQTSDTTEQASEDEEDEVEEAATGKPILVTGSRISLVCIFPDSNGRLIASIRAEQRRSDTHDCRSNQLTSGWTIC